MSAISGAFQQNTSIQETPVDTSWTLTVKVKRVAMLALAALCALGGVILLGMALVEMIHPLTLVFLSAPLCVGAQKLFQYAWKMA